METVVKRFDELTVPELYEIMKLRVDVFVVEQNCPYPELDGKDQGAFHVFSGMKRESRPTFGCWGRESRSRRRLWAG